MGGEVVVKAEPFLPVGNQLGEGILWDSKTQLLHWVDVPNSTVYSLDPETMKCTADHYAETEYLSAIALRRDEPGFVATMRHAVVLLPPPSELKPFEGKITPVERKSIKTIASPLSKETLDVVRFNDSGCDPQGRFLVGSMDLPPGKSSVWHGEVYRVSADGTAEKIFQDIGVSNGLGFSPDGKTFHYVDSLKMDVRSYDYPADGVPSAYRTLATVPPPKEGDSAVPPGCVFDGLCMDGQGNLWVARWNDGRVIGYKPSGEIIAQILTPGCNNPTIPIFGGKNLDKMYIVSANTSEAGHGPEVQAKYPESGDMLVVDFGPGTELRKVLGEGWKGAERHRFAG